jgi:hypothetical protein
MGLWSGRCDDQLGLIEPVEQDAWRLIWRLHGHGAQECCGRACGAAQGDRFGVRSAITAAPCKA